MELGASPKKTKESYSWRTTCFGQMLKHVLYLFSLSILTVTWRLREVYF